MMKHGLFVLALAACGRRDFDPLGDAAGSATRLHEVYAVYEDGPQIVEELYDSLLAMQCAVTSTASGLRCLPTNITLPYYLDAAYTQPAVEVDSCGSDCAYAYDPTLIPVDRVYAVGADIATPPMIYAIQVDGSCALGAAPTGMWSSASAVPLETFAGLTAVLGAGTRVRSEMFVADDGFMTAGPLQDTQVGASCTAFTFVDGSECGPYPAALAINYSDAACTHLVIATPVQVSFAVEQLANPVCNRADINIRPVIGDIDPMPLYVKYPGSMSCILTARGPNQEVLDLGPPIALAALVRQHVTTGKRIEAIQDVVDEATAIDDAALYDTQLMTECREGLATDGTERCLPTQVVPVDTYFSDAGCSVSLQLAGDIHGACAGPPAEYADDLTGGGFHIYPIGAQYTGPVYSGIPGSCSPAVAYTIGAELPASAFALVTEQIGP